jgi:hypothetical protein
METLAFDSTLTKLRADRRVYSHSGLIDSKRIDIYVEEIVFVGAHNG